MALGTLDSPLSLNVTTLWPMVKLVGSMKVVYVPLKIGPRGLWRA